MRVYALYLLVVFLSLYAYRDWFKSLCGLILLMAVIEHPDMPKTIGGIQGLNMWNVLMANVLLGWLIARRREGLEWDMPRSINALLILYLLVVLIGFARMMADRSHLEEFTTADLVSENLINTLKWVIPGLLVFDGCRSRGRLKLALGCTLVMYALLAVQVIRWMPPDSALSGSDLEARSRKIIENEVGYHRVNMSAILAGGSWAVLATLPLFARWRSRAPIIVAFLGMSYAQALTGGRMGYATWGCVGLVMCLVRWRKALPLFPIVAILIVGLLPGVSERMLQGFDTLNASGQSATDDYELTAGRTLIWPHVIDKIAESPAIGHGRLAMKRTGLADFLMARFGESFPHPHNAYLQLLLDNGAVGALPILFFYLLILRCALQQFRAGPDVWCVAAGGATLALVLSLMIASAGSQTFYPREAAVGMWVAFAISQRLVTVPRPTVSRAWASSGHTVQRLTQKYP